MHFDCGEKRPDNDANIHDQVISPLPNGRPFFDMKLVVFAGIVGAASVRLIGTPFVYEQFDQ